MKVYAILLYLLILLIVEANPLFGQTEPVENLNISDAVAIGLENNYSIRIARNQAAVTANNVSIGNAGFLPTLSAVGSRSFTKENITQQFLDGSQNILDGATSESWNGSLEVNYTIFDGLNTFITYERLQELNNLGITDAQFAIEQTVLDIMLRYYDIVQQQKILEVFQSTLEVSRERIQIAETQLEVGSGSRFELLQAKTDFNTDRAAELEQKTIVGNAKLGLNRVMGRTITKQYNVDGMIPVDRSMDFALLQQNAIKQNIQLQSARVNQQVAELDIKQIRTELLPQLDIQFSYDYTDFESSSGFLQSNKSNGFTYVVTGRVNIFDALNKRRRIQNAQIERKNSRLAIEDQKQIISTQLEQTYKNYLNALELIVLEKENVEFARQRQEIAVDRFRLGSTNSIELREAQRALIDTESRLIAAQFRAKQAEIQLQQLSGDLVTSLNLNEIQPQ